ncbi:MAG: ribonuclease J [Proteobacteria bacterium]|nr:ribonuclease J [Pseudomonadota bacterium]
MNLYLYGLAGRWLMVDLGVTFGDDSTPMIDVMMADPTFIRDRRDELAGLVLTHAHEDHLGAVPYLWPELRCPVYATAFAAAVLRRKLADVGLEKEVPLTEVRPGERFRVGPFDLELIPVTHSIPEPNALVLRTPLGTILHTGDWKLDPEPLIGAPVDEARFRRLGEEGVLAMVCDSTNVLRPGESGSEAEVRRSLTELIGRYRGRVAVACFATNVARVESVAKAALANGRQFALVGRSLLRIVEAAKETGYLADLPPAVGPDQVGSLPDDKVLLLCTGCQGEPRAALARIAAGDHPDLALGEGDVAIFSSRIIPGNERAIGRVQNALVRRGVEVVTEKDHFVHVSGHPARDEVSRLYELVRPRISVPVHGEWRHLSEHARVAEECGVPQRLLVGNGEMIRFAPGPAKVVDHVSTGRLAVDGNRLLPLEGRVVRSRYRLMYGGIAVATVVVDADGRLAADPLVAAPGLLDGEGDAPRLAVVAEQVGAAVEGLPRSLRRDDDALREAARVALRRALLREAGKRTMVEVHLVRV